MSDDGSTHSHNRKLERAAKNASRWLFAKLASKHHKNWRGVEVVSPKKIIVIRQHNQFGDVLCTVPLLRVLHSKFQPDELAVVVSPQNIAALEGCPYVTSLIEYDKLSFYKKPSLFFKFIKKLRSGYDVLLVPSNVSISLTNDIMAFFVKAPIKIGPRSLENVSNKTSSVYDVAVDLQWGDKIVHQSYRNMKIATLLGVEQEGDTGELEYKVREDLSAEAKAFLKKIGNNSSRKIAIHAGAGKAPNRWDAGNFARLAELLHDELGAELYLTEGPMDHEIMDKLANLMKVPFVRIRNRAIPLVAAFLERMNLVVTNDTGIMHLSAAVGTSTLSLFGHTDPLQWAPIGKKHKFILGKGGDIDSISVDKVFAVIKKALEKV